MATNSAALESTAAAHRDAVLQYSTASAHLDPQAPVPDQDAVEETTDEKHPRKRAPKADAEPAE